MSTRLTTFEVRVRIKGTKAKGYNSQLGCFYFDEIIKMYHKLARTGKQAMDKCRKHGTPISARKVDVGVMFKDFEKLPIMNEVYTQPNPYSSAIAMDEMIWQKRNKRRNNLYKDKPY